MSELAIAPALPARKRRLSLTCQSQRHVDVVRQPGGDTWYLLHLVIGETVMLDNFEAASWAIRDNEAGMAFLTAYDSDDEPITDEWAADMLSMQLYVSEGGEHFVQFGDGMAVPLDVATATRSEYKLGWLITACRCLVQTTVVVYALQDMGCRVWLKLEDIFDAAGFSQCMRRTDNKWLHDGLPRWIRWIADDVSLPLSIRRSQPLGVNGLDCPLATRRFLPWVASTLSGSIALLTRFAFLQRGMGGLSDPRAVKGAQELLEAMLRRASLPLTLTMFVDIGARWRPPRPLEGSAPVTLVLGKDLLLNIDAFLSKRACILSGFIEATGDTIAALRSMPSKSLQPVVGLSEWLSLLVNEKRLLPFLGQFCVHIGLAIEEVVLQEEKVIAAGERGGSKEHLQALRDDDYTSGELQREMAAYQLAGIRACEVLTNIVSIAADGSRVCAKKRLFGITLLPFGEAMRDIRGEMREAVLKNDSKGLAVATTAWRAQCAAWTKQTPAGYSTSKKVHRKSAYEFLVAVENGVRQSCGSSWSLERFMLDPDVSRRGDPLGWPRLCLAADCGSDNFAAINFLVRQCSGNIDFYPDDSHGCKNDMKAVMRGASMWQWCLLMTSAFNCWLSPFWECMRFQQVKDAIAETLSLMSPAEDVLFQYYLEALLRDRNQSDRICEDDIETTLHDDLKHASCFWQSGRRVSLMRFMDFIMKAGEEDPLWHSKLYGMLSALMLLGELSTDHSTKFGKALRTAAMRSGDSDDKKTVKQGDEDLKVLREFAANQLHLAAVMYAEPANQQKVRAVLIASQPALRWWSDCNHAQRSVEDGRAWMIGQANGKFFQFTDEVVDRMMSREHLAYIGFEIDEGPGPCKQSEAHIQVELEDELAAAFCKLCVLWLGHRIKRMMHLLRGWPDRCVLFAADRPIAAQAARDLRDDHDRYCRLVLEAPDTLFAKTLKKRSLFETPLVQQYVAHLARAGWRVDEELRAFEFKRSARLWGSQIIEDVVHYCKAIESKANSKRVSDLRLYQCPVKRKVAEEVHRFRSPVSQAVVVSKRAAVVDDEVFQMRIDHAPSRFKEVKGFVQTPTWYSPQADARQVPVVDLDFAKYLEVTGQIDVAHNADLVCLMRDQHNLLVRDTTGATERGAWILPLVQITVSCAIGWLVDIQKMSGPSASRRDYFRLRKGKAYTLIFMVEPRSWVARRFEWWSPLHQQIVCAKQTEACAANLICRGICVSAEMPLLKACAMTAFGSLPKSTLTRVAKRYQVPIARSGSLFEVVYDLVGFALGSKKENEILDALRHRFESDACESFVAEALQQEFFHDLLDRDEKEEVAREVEHIKKHDDDAREFKKAWSAKHVVATQSKASGAKSRPRGGSASGIAAWKGATELPLDISETYEVKHLAPPGAFIWRANSHAGWAGHLKPHPRVSAPWSLSGGHRAALKRVLARLWEQYLGDQGLPKTAIPIKGIFDE